MPSMVVKMEGDGAWPDLSQKKFFHLTGDHPPIEVAVLDRGSGKPSLALRIDLPDGKVVIAEISARIFCSVARIIQAKYPDLFLDN